MAEIKLHPTADIYEPVLEFDGNINGKILII